MRFIFFTKTDWSEPPRLRHQLARLLADSGYEVIFFQRPYYLWQPIEKDNSSHNRISLYRYRQLIHHKLRTNTIIHWINAIFEKRQISAFYRNLKISRSDVIINFNYDYYFLVNLCPNARIITIINDDFWSHGLLGWSYPLKRVLRKTLLNSNHVLTVSKPLSMQLSEIVPVELLYPWSDKPYLPPNKFSTKNIILFWGYINNKLDFDFISELAQHLLISHPDWYLMFVGPVQTTTQNINQFNNIKIMPPADLEDIDTSSVIAGLIPYRSGIPSLDVITFPNKLLRLLAKGIPVAITGMPDFIDEPFVFRLDRGPENAVKILESILTNHVNLQPIIKDFVERNSKEERLRQIMTYL